MSRTQRKNIAGVLLDVDGTLIDSNDAHANAWVEALAELGPAISFDTVRPLIGKGGRPPTALSRCPIRRYGWRRSGKRDSTPNPSSCWAIHHTTSRPRVARASIVSRCCPAGGTRMR